MKKRNFELTSIFLCSFLDAGPEPLDYFSHVEFDEDIFTIATRLMVKATYFLKGDEQQSIEQAIIGQLNGPDVFPTNPNYRVLWYNWFLKNEFAKDHRIKESGSLTGIYCVYKKEFESELREILALIDQVLNILSNKFISLSVIVNRMLGRPLYTNVTPNDIENFLNERNNGIIAKQMYDVLIERINKYLQLLDSQESFSRAIIDQQYISNSMEKLTLTGRFKYIFEVMILQKGTSEEVIHAKDKRTRWNRIITQLDKLIQEKTALYTTKGMKKKDLELVYSILKDKMIWSALPLGNKQPSIRSKDVADFFLYYWLSYHNLLEKQMYKDLFRIITG